MGFEPVYDENSRILILGSFPSVKSRETEFYYGHKQNRFWRVAAALTGEPVPVSVEQKKRLLLKHGIALWDVIESCDIIGSADSTIRNVVPADINRITKEAPIEKIFVNGGTASRLYDKFLLPVTGTAATKLSSTSPANARMSLDELIDEWGKAMELAGETDE